MLMAVMGGRDPHLKAENPGKRALVVEAAVERDLANGAVGGDEVLARGADTLAAEVAHRRFTEQIFEKPGKLPLGQVREGGELFGFDGFAEASVHVAQRGFELLNVLPCQLAWGYKDDAA